MSCKYIVAIGSSAGGLDALKIFFDHTPLDSAAYFVLQHLPFDYQSKLNEILRRYSELKIVQPRDGWEIVQNHIYTLPPKMYLSVKDKKIRTIDRSILETTNFAFDIFLNSISEDETLNVIAVVLSGGGADGVEGITKIKQVGGRVIAQDPHTCTHPFMPINAINTGLVDYIVKPEAMPSLIHEKIIYEFSGTS